MGASSSMARGTLTKRVENLEQTWRDLATLPARVTALYRGFEEFRVEVRFEFASVRAEN